MPEALLKADSQYAERFQPRAWSSRILFHHRTQGQGAEGVHIRGMAGGFKNCGYQVDIIGPPGIDPFAVSVKPETASANNGSHGSLLNRFWHMVSKNTPQVAFEIMELGYNVYAYKSLRKMLSLYKYDFLYERYALNNFASTFLAQRYGIPLVLEVNDATVIERSRPCALKEMARSIERKVFEKANLLITITHHFKQLILDQYRQIPEEKILVLPNAIDPQRFEIPPSKKLRKEYLGIQARYVIGCVGAFVYWHGLDFLLQSVHDLLEEMDIHVLLVGDGPVRKDLEKLINVLNIQNRVTITGFVDYQDVPRYIELFDIGLMAGSNMHGSPMKIFEYMALGVPPIAADYPPLREIIRDGEDGSLFPPNDTVSLRMKIRELLDDGKMRNRMGRRAKEKVMNQFTWLGNAEKLLQKLGKVKAPQKPSGNYQLIPVSKE
ncbi:MAG: glycosyltransferase family 4 protein [bacterium]